MCEVSNLEILLCLRLSFSKLGSVGNFEISVILLLLSQSSRKLRKIGNCEISEILLLKR